MKVRLTGTRLLNNFLATSKAKVGVDKIDENVTSRQKLLQAYLTFSKELQLPVIKYNSAHISIKRINKKICGGRERIESYRKRRETVEVARTLCKRRNSRFSLWPRRLTLSATGIDRDETMFRKEFVYSVYTGRYNLYVSNVCRPM